MGQEDGYLFGQDNVSWNDEACGMLVNKCEVRMSFECISRLCVKNSYADVFEESGEGECEFFKNGDECTNLEAQLIALSLTPFVQENRLAIIRLLLL
jgi:hypothetical protein